MSIKSFRAKVKREWGDLAKTFVEAMRIWDADKADGVSLSERLTRLERTLRTVWPQTREWKYLCTSCQDIGLVMSACPGDATCGRHKPHLPHDFGTPCWCDRGRAFRPKAKATPEDFTAAGKMTKVGRR